MPESTDALILEKALEDIIVGLEVEYVITNTNGEPIHFMKDSNGKTVKTRRYIVDEIEKKCPRFEGASFGPEVFACSIEVDVKHTNNPSLLKKNALEAHDILMKILEGKGLVAHSRQSFDNIKDKQPPISLNPDEEGYTYYNSCIQNIRKEDLLASLGPLCHAIQATINHKQGNKKTRELFQAFNNGMFYLNESEQLSPYILDPKCPRTKNRTNTVKIRKKLGQIWQDRINLSPIHGDVGSFIEQNYPQLLFKTLEKEKLLRLGHKEFVSYVENNPLIKDYFGKQMTAEKLGKIKDHGHLGYKAVAENNNQNAGPEPFVEAFELRSPKAHGSNRDLLSQSIDEYYNFILRVLKNQHQLINMKRN